MTEDKVIPSEITFIEAKHSRNIAYYKSLSNFTQLDKYNEHYRKLTYTFAELLNRKPSYKAILAVLFRGGLSTLGVPFLKRETLAEKAEVSVRSVANFIKDASIFGIRVLKQLGQLDKRYGGYAFLVFVFGPVYGLWELPAANASKKKECTPSCTTSLHSVEETKVQQPQGKEAPSVATKQEAIKQESPSEFISLKDFKYIVQADAPKESTKMVYSDSEIVSPFDKDIDMFLSGYEIDEKVSLYKAIEKTLVKKELLFVNAKLSILKALETLKYFKKQEARGKFTFKKGEVAFLVYNINNEIDKATEQREEEQYDAMMKARYEELSSEGKLDNIKAYDLFAESYKYIPKYILEEAVSSSIFAQPAGFLGTVDDMPW